MVRQKARLGTRWRNEYDLCFASAFSAGMVAMKSGGNYELAAVTAVLRAPAARRFAIADNVRIHGVGPSAEAALRWRETWGYGGRGSVVVVVDGEVHAWVHELGFPDRWQPGSLASARPGQVGLLSAATAQVERSCGSPMPW